MPTDVKLDSEHVTVEGILQAQVSVAWKALPTNDAASALSIPIPEGQQTVVDLSDLLGLLLSRIVEIKRELAIVTESRQQQWRWCKNCEGLFYAGHATKGVCPSGGGAHDLSQSGKYEIVMK